MYGMNALQKELVDKGLAKRPRFRKRKGKVVTCNKCGHPMEVHEGTNVMACTNCSAYFIFDKDRVK